MGSFSAFSNNNIGNMGEIRFAARWEPQYRNANRENNGPADIEPTSFSKPNIVDMNEGKKNSTMPRIDIKEAEIK